MGTKITVTDALTKVYTALCMLTVQGPDNAKILASVCDDLETIIEVIKKGGEKADDTEKNTQSDS